MTEQPMIEKAGEAILALLGQRYSLDHFECEAAARAVAQAWMEPIPGMVEAAAHDSAWDDEDSTPSTDIAAALWKAMLTAALNEGEGE